MEKVRCANCLVNNTTITCGLCEAPTCKTCTHFFDNEAFSFLPKVPDHLTKGTYCVNCFHSRVAGDLELYEAAMEAAKKIDVYFKTQGKETRLIRREIPSFEVRECTDRDELIMRLAFLAAHAGFTTLVDTDIIAEKRRQGTYQTTVFHGTAAPANAKANQIPKDRSLRHSPN